MKPDLYNERTSRAHYKRFKEILYSPGVLNLSSDIDSLFSATSASVIKSTENESVSTENINNQNLTEVPNDSSANSEVVTHDNTNNSELNKSSDQVNTEIKKNDAIDEAKEAEDEYVKMVKEFQEVIKDAKRNISAPSMDKETIHFEHAYRSPIDSDFQHLVMN